MNVHDVAYVEADSHRGVGEVEGAPLLIAETAVGPQAGQTQGITNLFAGVRAQHDLGIVWFDQHSYGGLYKGENWRLEGDPGALTTFRHALKG